MAPAEDGSMGRHGSHKPSSTIVGKENHTAPDSLDTRQPSDSKLSLNHCFVVLNLTVGLGHYTGISEAR